MLTGLQKMSLCVSKLDPAGFSRDIFTLLLLCGHFQLVPVVSKTFLGFTGCLEDEPNHLPSLSLAVSAIVPRNPQTHAQTEKCDATQACHDASAAPE